MVEEAKGDDWTLTDTEALAIGHAVAHVTEAKQIMRVRTSRWEASLRKRL